MEITLTKENFEEEVLKSQEPVFIDFWASWCGPCKMMDPVVKEIAEEYQGKMKVGKVNVDEQPELAGAFRVQSIPTFYLVKDGKAIAAAAGAQPKQRLLQTLKVDQL